MNIVKATRRFEKWLAQHVTLVPADLRFKHQRMAESPFAFFRSTFYRWMQLWPEVGEKLTDAPSVLAVGDLHVENFGTWRDIEGRLVWGVNDFDEAAVLPYTLDLVRLATSAMLAAEEGHLSANIKDGFAAILDGYHEALVEGGRPFVLEEEHEWLREVALNELRDPVRFWQKMDGLPKFDGRLPSKARGALEQLMPEPDLSYKLCRRVAGLGSLGHVRAVALALWHGGRIAREAKSLAPSSVYWAKKHKGPAKILYPNIIDAAVRCPDPFVKVRGVWLVRRLSPHCSRIELTMLPKEREELRLLNAMGWEAGNIHLGTAGARKSVRKHLDGMKPGLLMTGVRKMAKAVTNDWKAWKASNAARSPAR
ncbi:MAG TPA: DUF2252 family protein [Terriglobales bacterium]|nr:DUF2252 family protein [Terriglobales bacterium]